MTPNGREVPYIILKKINTPDGSDKYDLKGSINNRTTISKKKTLKDNNFRGKRFVFNKVEDHEIFHSILRRDTKFLELNHILDYSLFAVVYKNGMTPSPDEHVIVGDLLDANDTPGTKDKQVSIVFSIIDIFQYFNITKRIERLLKIARLGSSVTSPMYYRMRFLSFMLDHFVLEDQGACKYSGHVCAVVPSCMYKDKKCRPKTIK